MGFFIGRPGFTGLFAARHIHPAHANLRQQGCGLDAPYNERRACLGMMHSTRCEAPCPCAWSPMPGGRAHMMCKLASKAFWPNAALD